MRAMGKRLSEPAVWAVLLVGALGFAFQTWTREPVAADRPVHLIWRESPQELLRIVYEASDRSAELELREEDGDRYYWGVTTRPRPISPGVSAEELATRAGLDTAAFVVGAAGDRLVEEMAAPAALRDFGVLEESGKARFGLADPVARVTLQFRRATRELLLGDRVFGSVDRYALDPATGRAYVLRGEGVGLLEDAAGRLRETRLHAFAGDDVVHVVVRSGAEERVMERTAGDRAAPAVWAAPDSPDRPDQRFGLFMERLARLSVREFDPAVDLSREEPLVRVEYFDHRGEPLGFAELFRIEAPAGQPEILLRSELTRVAARTYDLLAEELLADAAQIL